MNGWRNKMEYNTEDSGERHEYDSGMVRDTTKGKAKFNLLMPIGVRYEEQMLTRLAELMTRGAEKYGDRNWEKADTQDLDRFKESAFRHFMQWFAEADDGEDHASAVMFNILAYETTYTKHILNEPYDYPDEDELNNMEKYYAKR